MRDTSLPSTIIFIDPVPEKLGSTIFSLNNSLTLIVDQKHDVQGITNFPLNRFNLLTIRNTEDTKFGNYGYILKDKCYFRLSYNFEKEIFEISIISDIAQAQFRYIQNIFKMVSYTTDIKSENINIWESLTSSLDSLGSSNLKSIIKTEYLNAIYVDTHLVTKQDVDIVEVCQKTILEPNYQLEFTPINFKSTQAIRKGFEMDDFLDTSYYLKVLSRLHKTINLWSELQLSFILGHSLANYSCFMQWHRILELIFKCKDKIALIKYMKKSIFETTGFQSDRTNYLLQLHQLIFMQWNMLDWDYKLHFINVKVWMLILDKIEFSVANLEVEGDDVSEILYKIRRQLIALAEEAEEDPFADDTNNSKADIKEIDSEDNEETISFDSTDDFVNIYGSSDDEFEPAVVSKVTYHRKEFFESDLLSNSRD